MVPCLNQGREILHKFKNIEELWALTSKDGRMDVIDLKTQPQITNTSIFSVFTDSGATDGEAMKGSET